MWQEKIKEIEAQLQAFGLAPLPPGAPADALAAWCREVEKRCGAPLPPEYLEVLGQVNGVQWNGCILYGVDRAFLPGETQETSGKGHRYGLLERNDLWRETEERYLFFGESGISWYVMELSTGRFFLLDNPSGEEMETFDGFSRLLESLLEESLG